MFQLNDSVVQVVPTPISGTIIDMTVDVNSGTIKYLVQWTDENEVVQTRYFSANEIQAA